MNSRHVSYPTVAHYLRAACQDRTVFLGPTAALSRWSASAAAGPEPRSSWWEGEDAAVAGLRGGTRGLGPFGGDDRRLRRRPHRTPGDDHPCGGACPRPQPAVAG